MAAAAGVIEMSAAGLHKRMRTIGPYLARLVTLMTDAEVAFAAERWSGYDVVIVDGSSESRPAAEGATARVHHAATFDAVVPHLTIDYQKPTIATVDGDMKPPRTNDVITCGPTLSFITG
jgi:hypothetical protein